LGAREGRGRTATERRERLAARSRWDVTTWRVGAAVGSRGSRTRDAPAQEGTAEKDSNRAVSAATCAASSDASESDPAEEAGAAVGAERGGGMPGR